MRELTIYTPGSFFPSVSVTGSSCAMSCAHCSGKYLKGMVDVSKPGSLFSFGIELWRKGGEGMLVSGGCDPFGAVDFPDHTFKEMRSLKTETDLLINLHCGLVDDKTADIIAGSGVDKVSFDLVYDDDTIREVLKQDAKKEDYIDTISLLRERDLDVVPHILAGLNRGKISWEFSAVDQISRLDMKETVLIILIPTKGTDFHDVKGPDDDQVLELAVSMKEKLKGRVILGCMRPKGSNELEKDILMAGFDGIVLPSRSTMRWINDQNWNVEKISKCCCM